MSEIKQLDAQYVAGTYARFPLELTSGKGAVAWDENGKEYIDLGSGIAVNTFGYSDDAWADAVSAQAHSLQHTSNLYYTHPCVLLAQALCERTGMKKVFFGNSGAEANECAIKVARKWALDTYGPGRETIITLKNSFHGRTLATLAATGQDVFHTHFGPFPGGFAYAEAENLASVEEIAKQGCAAVLLEVVQGEGGVVALSKEFLHGVEGLCEKYGMLLMIDEVQSGNGRSGQLYAYMHYGLKPDVVSTAKGLAGGLPLGACLMGQRVENTLGPGTHGSTFGGNPICCAAALSVISRLDETLLSQVREKSQYIISRLTGAAGVKSVTGLGLMLGIDSIRPAKDVIAACRERGVLVLSAKTKIRLLPPLNIDQAHLEKAINILEEELGK